MVRPSRLVVILDTCYSGSAVDEYLARGRDLDDISSGETLLPVLNQAAVLAAAEGHQKAYEVHLQKNAHTGVHEPRALVKSPREPKHEGQGLLTFYLLRFLEESVKHVASRPDSLDINVLQWFDQTASDVREYTAKLGGARQDPRARTDGPLRLMHSSKLGKGAP